MSEKRDDTQLTYSYVTDKVLAMLELPGRGWYALFALALAAFMTGAASWTYQILIGMGASGKSHPISWGFYITNFVFWVGIAHSGTLISAVLYLFRAKFRMPVYRLADAMTVFAVMTAGLFPLIHLGRVWFFYWLMPYPTQRALWPNFRSPLVWDVFAVSTYFTISAVFFYVGRITDLAVARDRARSFFRRILYGITSLGWTGSSSQWRPYLAAYLLFAALATPLVVSVHSIVSWDFAMSIVPGWHSTIFAPYFVAGAIFSGVGMVITLSVPLRKVFGLERIITVDHYENLAKLIMLTSGIVTYSYLTEFYVAWFSNNPYERFQFWFRPFGEFWPAFWGMTICNCILPLSLWFRKLRRNIVYLFVLSITINIGMWLERFNIIFTSLARDYMPAAWGAYNFSWTDFGMTIGAFGWFGMLLLLFIKFFPAVAITEIKEILPQPVREGEAPLIRHREVEV